MEETGRPNTGGRERESSIALCSTNGLDCAAKGGEACECVWERKERDGERVSAGMSENRPYLRDWTERAPRQCWEEQRHHFNNQPKLKLHCSGSTGKGGGHTRSLSNSVGLFFLFFSPISNKVTASCSTGPGTGFSSSTMDLFSKCRDEP